MSVTTAPRVAHQLAHANTSSYGAGARGLCPYCHAGERARVAHRSPRWFVPDAWRRPRVASDAAWQSAHVIHRRFGAAGWSGVGSAPLT